jgi:predicted ATPase
MTLCAFINFTGDNMIHRPNFFLLTGGPGSGKSSVLLELQRRGYQTISEVARDIIKAQLASGGNAMHTGDRQAFLSLMLEQSLTDYHQIDITDRPVIFDRGIPDLYGYAQGFCSGVTQPVAEAAAHYRYNQAAFIFPPWLDIYQNDSERQQNFQEAIKTYHALKTAYQHCQCRLLEVPEDTIKKRADYIICEILDAL